MISADICALYSLRYVSVLTGVLCLEYITIYMSRLFRVRHLSIWRRTVATRIATARVRTACRRVQSFRIFFKFYRRKFLFWGRWIRALESSYEAMLEENKSTKTWKPPFGEVLKLVCPGVNTGIVFKTMQCNKF